MCWNWKLYKLEAVTGPYYRVEHMHQGEEAHALLAAREVLFTERDVLLVRPGVRQVVTVTVSVETSRGSDVFRELGTWRIEGASLSGVPTYTPTDPPQTLEQQRVARSR